MRVENSTFAQDVLRGLSASPKRLFSRYLYNERGNQLFQAIMQVEEYYLTRSEYEVLETYRTELLTLFQVEKVATESLPRETVAIEEESFELIEFGAGDGMKIKILLRYFLDQGASFRYVPIDISAEAVNGLVADLRTAFPGLETEGVQDEYFRALQILKQRSSARKVVLFLGANIGNFTEPETLRFLSGLRENLNPGDRVMIGFDLKKNPAQILAAYNDAAGVTRAFNLNLLQRINDELGGNFDLDAFQHYPTYDPLTGEARSYLLSTRAQTVRLTALNATFSFDSWEPIHVEISRKYDLPTITRLAEQTGFRVVQHFFDQPRYFVDTVWEVGG